MFPIDKTVPLYEQVYFNLKQLILDGELKPNCRLIDTKIAEELEISRSPVREALRKLEQDKLVTNLKGIITVYNPSLLDVIELYKVRSGLEYVAAYWATKYIGDQSLNDLQNVLVQAEKAFSNENYEEVIKLNTHFHDTIVNASGNSHLIDIMKTNRSLILLCRKILFKNNPVNLNFVEEHQLVLNNMVKKSPKKAAECMEKHIYNDMNYFKSIFNQQVNRKSNSF